MALIPPVTVSGLFTGRVAQLAGESRASAIAKVRHTESLLLSDEGLAGDEHADLQVHGGLEKALHHWPAEHYATLAGLFPDAAHFVPGGLGENISTHGITEANVCIGDIFSLGTARIQIAQPRTPCWKIDSRCGTEGVANHVAEHGMAGWYYRVLDAGEVTAGDLLTHVERMDQTVTLSKFWQTIRTQRPSLEALHRLANLRGLTPDWRRKLNERIDWLQRNV